MAWNQLLDSINQLSLKRHFMFIPVIIAGGSGTRLWPLSRSLYPKQFLPLSSEYSMLQETLLRLEGLSALSPITICNEEHRFIVAEQLRSIDRSGSIILEPSGRNTAPAIALAAQVTSMLMNLEDPVLLVLPADHIIKNHAELTTTIAKALPLAEQGSLVTFGIAPRMAHTGYGYIQRGEQRGNGYQVQKFVEKPAQEIAQAYIEAGDYYWNSGMFLFKASRYLEELEAYRPDIYSACMTALENSSEDLDFIRVNKEAFLRCPEESIDYAVMEKTEHAVVVPLDAGWDDIGSWSAVWEIGEHDQNGNATRGDTILHDSKDCLLYGGERLITAVGLENIVVVDTKDAVLVADKHKVQEVKKVVEHLKAEGRSEFKLHREVFRPWGSYDSIEQGERYQVKRITVQPGQKLSLQMHHHRAEHWIVVSGTAKVTNGDQEIILSENQSTYIPLGTLHRLENPGKIPLEIIEVQSGSYLGEDDIVRFEDSYGRTK